MKPFLFIFLLPVVLALAGCETTRDQSQQNAAGRSGIFPSRWDGEWRSAKHHGMHGRLRCLLTKVDDRHYRAQFHANWLVFTSSYTVVLETNRTDNVLHLRGKHELRGFGGATYRYEGTVTGSRFTANYDSSYDRGTFVMAPAGK